MPARIMNNQSPVAKSEVGVTPGSTTVKVVSATGPAVVAPTKIMSAPMPNGNRPITPQVGVQIVTCATGSTTSNAIVGNGQRIILVQQPGGTGTQVRFPVQTRTTMPVVTTQPGARPIAPTNFAMRTGSPGQIVIQHRVPPRQVIVVNNNQIGLSPRPTGAVPVTSRPQVITAIGVQNRASSTSQPIVSGGTQAQPSGTAGTQLRPPAPAPPAVSPPTEELRNKCRNFLGKLLTQASMQANTNIFAAVKGLVQALIDGRVPEDQFTIQLQKELKSKPQPQLTYFLVQSLPHLRQAMIEGTVSIEHINPPPSSNNQTKTVPAAVDNKQATSTSQGMTAPVWTAVNTGQPVRIAPHMKGTMEQTAGDMGKQIIKISREDAVPTTVSTPPQKSATPKVVPKTKKKLPPKRMDNSLVTDELNSVTAMGGINVKDEKSLMLSSSIGSQPLGIQGERGLCNSLVLRGKINTVCKKYGMVVTNPKVLEMLNQALEERLNEVVEKVDVISSHRSEILRFDHRYSIVNNVKAQLNFLSELEREERKRKEEEERHMMMKIAKSRNKTEDPEHMQLKKKAKEMQRLEMEEMRQREANITALEAIGQRKKPRLDEAGPSEHGVTNPAQSIPSTSQQPTAPFPQNFPSVQRGGVGILRSQRTVVRATVKDLAYVMSGDCHIKPGAVYFRMCNRHTKPVHPATNSSS